MTVREFLEQIAKEEIIQGEQYFLRIEIDERSVTVLFKNKKNDSQKNIRSKDQKSS